MKDSSDAGSTRRNAIAWAGLTLEALLFLTAVLVFSRYWIMLPVKYRMMGLSGLILVGAIGLFRVVRLLARKS